MKKKKLKKALIGAIKEYNNSLNNPKSKTETPIPTDLHGTYNMLFSETNEDVKKSIKKLVIKLLEHRDEIEFNCSEYSISISKKTIYTPSMGSKDSIYFSIEIQKDTGFILNCNEKRIYFKYESLYSEVFEQIRAIFDSININNFNELYSIIMKNNGYNRESNLDDILSEFRT